MRDDAFIVHLPSDVASDGRGIAVKQIREELETRDDLIERLRAEGAFLVALHGENGVLRAYEILDAPIRIVLELADGGSLAENLARGALLPGDAVRIFRDVARAVGHTHAHGIIHRDIKPSNILFTASGDLRLADFGIAVHRGARSTTAGWDDIDVGTLGYAPPELLRDPSTANTEPVDIYELGALLHELLLGATPHMMHGAETEAELKARIIAGELRDLTPRESELSAAQRRLLDAALAPNPSERPQSVTELLALL